MRQLRHFRNNSLIISHVTMWYRHIFNEITFSLY